MAMLLLGVGQAGWLALSIFGLSAWFSTRGAHPLWAISGGLASFAVIALVFFWTEWYFTPQSKLVLFLHWTSLFVFLGLATKGFIGGHWRAEYSWPLLIGFLATLLLLFVCYGISDHPYPLRFAAERWTHSLPPDNAIPFEFARKMLEGLPVSPVVGDWLSSDRPPLQTALYLLSPALLFQKPLDTNYQAAAVAMQMLILPGAWVLARTLNASIRVAVLCMAAIFFMPLTIVNGSFVWPKLLSAAFLCAAAGLHFGDERKQWQKGLCFGCLCCLSFLSHGAAAFVLLAMPMVGLMGKAVGRLGYVIPAALAFVVLYAPWQAYQRFVDPPATRLIKWHLADVTNVDPRTPYEAIKDQYRTVTWQTILDSKKQDFYVMTRGTVDQFDQTSKSVSMLLSGNVSTAKAILLRLRTNQFFYVALGIGIIGFAFYALPLMLFMPGVRLISGLIVLSLLIWTLTMFQPGGTVIHQGSLFPEVGIVVLAIVLIGTYSFPGAAFVAALQVILTTYQYLI